MVDSSVIVPYNSRLGTRMKHSWWLLGWSRVNGAWAADLLAVYQRALQNDPQLREAEAHRLAALESKPQALSALLPQLSGTALASKERDVGPSRIATRRDEVQAKPSGQHNQGRPLATGPRIASALQAAGWPCPPLDHTRSATQTARSSRGAFANCRKSGGLPSAARQRRCAPALFR